MANANYVWSFNESALGAGVKGRFSLEYHLPAAKLKVDPSALVGSRLWLVVARGDERFLYALLSPATLERYRNGKYKDDLLLTAEPFLSVRFLPRGEPLVPWKLSSFREDDEIRECGDDELANFRELIKRNRGVGFAPPPRAVLESVPKTTFLDLERAVPDQLASVLRTVAFGDASRVQSLPPSISALGGIALAILKSTRPDLPEKEVVELLSSLDIAANLDSLETSSDEILNSLNSLPPVVDTFLEEVDPDKISPRTFVAATKPYSSEWLDKTNDAEEAHERILKDLVLRSRGKGFKTYKSRSFDLFAEKGDARLLWEIKSATPANSAAQGEKGIVQLLRYSTALSDNGFGGVRFLLLLQDTGQTALRTYLFKMAARAGIEAWFYDGERDWPSRVRNSKGDGFLGL